MESWKVNLISVWFGCFFTGLAISQILPFLPLYVSQLGVTSHEALSMWSGLTFSVTFLVSAIVSPMWGSLADRKGRKLMLLRANIGAAILMPQKEIDLAAWYFIPEKKLTSYDGYFTYRDRLSLRAICAQLGVSQSAAVIRLRQLGYLEDRPYSEFDDPTEVWA